MARAESPTVSALVDAMGENLAQLSRVIAEEILRIRAFGAEPERRDVDGQRAPMRNEADQESRGEDTPDADEYDAERSLPLPGGVDGAATRHPSGASAAVQGPAYLSLDTGRSRGTDCRRGAASDRFLRLRAARSWDPDAEEKPS